MFIGTVAAGQKLGKNPSTIRELAASGKIPKARKKKGAWEIPIIWVLKEVMKFERKIAK